MTRLMTMIWLALAVPGAAGGALAAVAGAPDSARIEVAVDARLELLAVVQCLAGEPRLNDLHLSYRRQVLERFRPWQAHPAVTRYVRMRLAGFAHDVPPAVMLRLSDPPELELRAPFSAYLEQRAGGRERLFAFLDSLRSFARESRFMEFHAAHRAFFDRLVADTRSTLAHTQVLDPLEDYIGERAHGYHVLLSPLMQVGGYGAQVERPPGLVDCYAMLGPSGARRGRPRFWDAPQLEGLLWHEFGHSIVGRLPGECREMIAADSVLFEPLRERMRAQGYPDWTVCADEHLVRALGIRLVLRTAGARTGQQVLDRQRSLGFVYLPALVFRLRHYEEQRDRFRTLSDFCPELAAALHEEAAALLHRQHPPGPQAP